MKRINAIFNPTKITLSGKTKIVDTESGKYVIKPKKKNLKDLYEYLKVRSFNNYPELIDEYDDNYVYEYVTGANIPINQKASDMAKLLASLHNKTAYFKPAVKDNFKEVYENVLSNIIYFSNFFEGKFTELEAMETMPPSGYLILEYRSKINSLVLFLKKEIESWYKLVSDLDKERVVYCHNNLTIDHYLENEKSYFISWDNYTIDSPILDLINLYRNDYNKYDFSNFLSIYLNNFNLLPEEKKLFFIVISLPNISQMNTDEVNNTMKISKMINYLLETEKLIRPYYSVENIEQSKDLN